MRSVAVALVLGLLAIEGLAAQVTTPSSMTPEQMEELVARLDSGSQAFEDGRLEDSRRHHRRAVEIAPFLTSTWLGLFMVEDSLGHDEAADSALIRVHGISPGAVPPDFRDRLPASLLDQD